MKKAQARIAAAIAFTLGFSSLAQSVPIYFNFTATNTGSVLMPEGAVVGQTVTGGFTFETEQLVRRTSGPANPGVAFEGAPQAFLSFGDRIVSFPAPGALNGGYIFFYDGCRSADCESDEDSFSLSASTSEQSPETLAAGFTGTYRSASLFFDSSKDFVPPADLFDADTVDPTAIVDLPIPAIASGFYVEFVTSCVSGVCERGQAGRSFGFSVDSVTRGLGSRSVPEPGTLGLLGAGLLAAFVPRRRAALRRPTRKN